MNKTVGLWLGIAFILGTAFVLRSPYRNATLDEGYSDSIRHIYSSWLFLQYGLDVYRVPLREVASRDPSPGRQTPWAKQPYIYPPGALAIYVPFGYAAYGLELPEKRVSQAAIWTLFLISLGSVALMVKTIPRDAGLLGVLPVVLYALVTFQFSLNGMYDAAYIIPSLLAMEAARLKKPVRGLFWLSVAFFFHFRTLFYFPVAAAMAGRLVSRETRARLDRKDVYVLVVASTLVLPSLWALLETRQSFDLALHNELLVPYGWGGAAAAVGISVVAIAYLFRSGDRLTGLTVGWMAALTLSLPATRGWHSVVLYPLFALRSRTGRQTEFLLLWVLLFSGLAFRHFPNVRWLARGLATLTGGN